MTTFNEAFGEALKVTPPEDVPKGDRNYARLLAMMWTILAIAGKKGLDDIVYINDNQEIISIPLKKSATSTKKNNKTGKGKTKSKAKDKAKDKKPVTVEGTDAEKTKETKAKEPEQPEQSEKPEQPEPTETG